MGEVENFESESEEEHESESPEGSMTIEDTITTPLDSVNVENAYEEPRPSLDLFLGDEDIESDGEYLPLSEVGKKRRATARPTKVSSP